MRVILNGQKEIVPDGITVSDLLDQRKVQPIRVAVEINEDIVRRRMFDETVIHEGDRIEIATFVGGG
ncbi:MAG: sulfur carrier protein ThiS [Planctomycetes bacterium]|nr:sulfur carrier protein ThiS [Planctomycetota bacterium]